MPRMETPRQKAMAKIWAPAIEMWGREVADYFIHAHVLAEFGLSSLTSLSLDQLEEVAAWMRHLEYALGRSD